jgi:hypothetical protein
MCFWQEELASMNEREKQLLLMILSSYFLIPLQRYCIDEFQKKYLIIYSGDIGFVKKSLLKK